jgi:hypothetical protein
MAFKISSDTIINDNAQFGSDLTLVNENGISYITNPGAFTSSASGNDLYLGYGSSLVDITAPNVTYSSGNSNALDFSLTGSNQSAYKFVMKIAGNNGIAGATTFASEVSSTSPTGTSNRFYRFDASVDGIHWYGYDKLNYKFMHFTASTAWDASTLSSSDEFSISGTDSASRDLSHIRISENGEYFYRSTLRNIYKYDLSTQWDISSASLASTTPNPLKSPSDDAQINFKRDGTKMLLSDPSAGRTALYELSTPWDTSTLTRIKKVDYDFISGNSLKLSLDGTEVLGLNASVGQTAVWKYNWLTPWELDSTKSNSFSNANQTSSVSRTLTDFVPRPGGHLDWKLLPLSGAFADKLYKYNITDSAGAVVAEKLQFPGNVHFENGLIEFPDSGQTSYVEFISIDSGDNWYAKELYKG